MIFSFFVIEYIKQIQEKTARNFLPVSNLEENVTSTFTVQAETSVGYGPPVTGKVTVGPQPGTAVFLLIP